MNSSKKCEAHLTAQRLFQGPKCKTNPRHMPEKIKMQLRMNMQCKHSLHANISPNMTQDSKYLKETSTKYNLITLNFIDGKILKKSVLNCLVLRDLEIRATYEHYLGVDIVLPSLVQFLKKMATKWYYIAQSLKQNGSKIEEACQSNRVCALALEAQQLRSCCPMGLDTPKAYL